MVDIEPYSGDESYIFISYAHKDKDIVLPILERMHNCNYRFWFDKGIHLGKDWSEEIAERLEKCKIFVSFITQNYLESTICNNELTCALDLKKQCLPIYLQKVEIPLSMKLKITHIQSMFYYKYADSNVFLKNLFSAEGFSTCRDDKNDVKVIYHVVSLQYPNGDVYKGEIEDLGDGEFYPEGHGIFTYANGDVFDGDFECGIPVYGRMDYANGDIYEGRWTYQEVLDENGNITLDENGDIVWLHEKNGEGIYYYANGDQYEGSWYNGKPHGHGCFLSKKDLCGFIGEWVHGKKHGKGKIVYSDKKVTDVEWVYGKLKKQ